ISRLLRGPRPSGILQNLKSLELHSHGPYEFLVHALNDAMVAFAGTLCTIQVGGSNSTKHSDEWDAESIMSLRKARMSKLLEDEPWANTIGGSSKVLPFPLLQLRSLSIAFYHTFAVQIGSFEQCPNLESLEIQFGWVTRDGTKDIVSVSQSDDGSIRARIALFPTWNLPRLRELELHHLAALRFDWESLSSMPRLEKLKMDVDDAILNWYKPSHYIEDQKDFWKSKMDLWEKNNGLDLNSSKGKWTWPLPWLHTLILDGPCTTMLYMDWIRFCPNLKYLSLSLRVRCVHFVTRFSPLVSSSSESSLNSDDPIGQPANNLEQQQPLLHSRLAKINIHGNLIMSDDDLQTLLTIYAPFLEHIYFLHDRCSMVTPFKILNIVHQADQINKSYAETLTATTQAQEESRSKSHEDNHSAANASEQEKHRQRLETFGTTLKSVVCHNTRVSILDKEIQELGLVAIGYNQVKTFKARNMRIYFTGNQYLVAQSDHDLMPSATESDHTLPRDN
ncbi:hypothetical protein BGX31_002414, partial [Mortierella sp. GBA43]